MASRFPIGGEREPVYEFFRSLGFVMSQFSDKHWTRADGLLACVYGTGSRVRVYRDDALIADGPIEEAMEKALETKVK